MQNATSFKSAGVISFQDDLSLISNSFTDEFMDMYKCDSLLERNKNGYLDPIGYRATNFNDQIFVTILTIGHNK